MTEEADSKQIATADLQKLFSGLPSRYEFRSILGTGGMGVVFRARDLHLDRDVAIKVLFLEETQNDSARKRFIQEAKTLATLNHPNIVKLLAYGESEQGALYEVMEFIDGKTLAAELKEEGRLPSARFFEVFIQVVTGLQDAHEKKLIHRDLKPGNIIICKADTETGFIAKIIDFGLAKNYEANSAADNLTKTNTPLGTPLYMSPEQCIGQQLDQRSDIYSLGCMMYEALTGKPPFDGNSAMELAYKHVNSDWEHLEQIASMKESKLLGKLVDDCLAKKPEARPKSAHEVLQTLRTIGSKRDDSLKLFGVTEKTKKKSSKIVILALLSTTLALGFVVIQILDFRNKQKELTLIQESKRIETANKIKRKRSNYSDDLGKKDVPRLSTQFQELERQMKAAKTRDEKTSCAAKLVKCGKSLHTCLLDAGDFDKDSEVANKLVKYAKETEAPDTILPEIYEILANNCLNAKKCQEAIHFVQLAQAAIKRDNMLNTYEDANAWITFAHVHVYAHEFAKAEADYIKAENIWLNGDQGIGEYLRKDFVEISNNSKLDSKIGAASGLFVMMLDSKGNNDQDTATMIRLANRTLRYVVGRRPVYAKKFSQGLILNLNKLPKNSKEYPKAAKDTYETLSFLEKAMKNEIEANKYSMMAKSIKQEK